MGNTVTCLESSFVASYGVTNNNRTNYAKEIAQMVYATYSSAVKVFDTQIPISVRTAEISAEGCSIYTV